MRLPSFWKLNRISESHPYQVRRLTIAAHVALQILLVFIIFFQVNYLGCRHYDRLDLTQNRKFTLSTQSLNFLDSLDSDIHIVMAFLRNSDIYGDLSGLLTEYGRNGGDHIQVEFVDPSRDRGRLTDLANQHNLTFSRNAIVLLAGGRVKIIGEEDLVTRSNDRFRRVMEFRGEEVLTSSLLEVSEKQQKRIYFVTGKRKAEELGGIYEQLNPLASAQNARLETLGLGNITEIPQDADAVVLAGTDGDLNEREVAMLRTYWEERKGGLFILLNPAADSPNLSSFFREHGVAPRDDRILSVATIPGVASRKTYDVPAVFLQTSPITGELAGIQTLLTGQTQSLAVFTDEMKARNIDATPLVATDPRFWGETNYQEDAVSASEAQDHLPPLFTAASIEKSGTGGEGKNRTSRMVVVSNPNLIDPAGNTRKANADFVMASLNWMIGRSELIGISPRKPSIYTLSITGTQFGVVQILFILVLPLLAVAGGTTVWVLRRR